MTTRFPSRLLSASPTLPLVLITLLRFNFLRNNLNVPLRVVRVCLLSPFCSSFPPQRFHELPTWLSAERYVFCFRSSPLPQSEIGISSLLADFPRCHRLSRWYGWLCPSPCAGLMFPWRSISAFCALTIQRRAQSACSRPFPFLFRTFSPKNWTS